MKNSYQSELFEHWCNNLSCDWSTDDPDGDEGTRHVLNGEITLNRSLICPGCNGELVNRLDMIRLPILNELNIDFKKLPDELST